MSSRRKRRELIIGLDGEGAGRSPHRYTLLAWSDETGGQSAHIADQAGLSTERCLRFLIEELPVDARVFGFFLGYDWTMMLKDLPNEKIYRLFRPGLRKCSNDEGGNFTPVLWSSHGRYYRLHYLAGMMTIQSGKKRVTIWDVGRFFQCSFVSALEKWGLGKDVIAEISAMKQKRSTFSARESKRILRYCLSECAELAKLVTALNTAHEEAGLKLNRWHGPGSTASIGLKKMAIGDKRGKQPPEVAYAAQCAFFGGRFEHAKAGLVKGPIYGNDIVSAYPAECVNLPCLEHGRWTRVTNERAIAKGAHAVVKWRIPIGVKTERTWGPLPCRMPNGTILFPRSGASGWVWRDEYYAARVHWPEVEFGGEAWVLRTRCKCQPFARVFEWFEERRRIGKSGRGIVLKLFLNSIYGKLAQSIGTPPFRSQVWAGMITSGTRAKLLFAIAQNESRILACATDGIYSSAPLDLDKGERLGQWEEKVYKSIVLVRPGIYWTPDTVRARGVGRADLENAQRLILNGIKKGEKVVTLPDKQQFGGALSSIYMTSGGQCRRSRNYGQWYDRPVRISLDPAPKRDNGYRLWDLPGVESTPYWPGNLSKDAKALKRLASELWASGS